MPVALLFHGGGWVSGDKDEIALDVLPYLAMGFAVANVDYRLARVATAPAAVRGQPLRAPLGHPPRQAIRARRRSVDPGRQLGGGAPGARWRRWRRPTAGFDGLCPGDEPLKVAAVINFFGVIDVGALLAPPTARDFAVGWIGNAPIRAALAQRVSPITYVHKGAPPIFTAHGDADPVVPFAQAQAAARGARSGRCPQPALPAAEGGPRPVRRRRRSAGQPRRARLSAQARRSPQGAVRALAVATVAGRPRVRVRLGGGGRRSSFAARPARRQRAAGSVPDPLPDRVGRDGRRLSGGARPAGAAGRGEVPAPLDRRAEGFSRPASRTRRRR